MVAIEKEIFSGISQMASAGVKNNVSMSTERYAGLTPEQRAVLMVCPYEPGHGHASYTCLHPSGDGCSFARYLACQASVGYYCYVVPCPSGVCYLFV